MEKTEEIKKPAVKLNEKCVRCREICKQTAKTRILYCPFYERKDD